MTDPSRGRAPEVAALRPLVRPGRPQELRPPLADAADGLCARRLPRPADHRHPQHLVRPQPLPLTFQKPGRGREARGAAGRGLSGRDAGDRALRDLHEADDDALPEPAGDGGRGADPRASGGRRGADGRLRQDHAGADHGGALGRPANDLPAGGADAARQLCRADAGVGLGRLEVLGRAPGGEHQRAAVARDRGRDRAVLRPLHDHGHRLDDDRDRRRHGADAARRLVDPGAGRQPYPHGLRLRAADRRHGLGGFDAGPDRDAGLGAERRGGGNGDRLLDQRGGAPPGDGAPRPGAADARRPRRAGADHAADRQRPAVGQGLPDGGFLLCRGSARADERDPRQAGSRPRSPSPAARSARRWRGRRSSTTT